MSGYVALRSLARRYDDVWAVSDLSLTIEKGESVALLGPSGCGKTTTLRMIAGLVVPTGGAIEVGGRDITRVPPHRRNLGYVFQSYALFPHMNVRANVAFGLEERSLPSRTWSGSVSPTPWRRFVSEALRRAARANCPAGSSSALPSHAHWRSSRTCCCSMSAFPTWTQSCAMPCAWSSARSRSRAA